MKALLVKDDGLIYAAEVPEEPKFGNPLYEGVRTELIRRDYQRKLASAKENAVLVSDQEKAKELIWQYGDQHNKPIVKPGLIVPIPGLDWEVKSCWITGDEDNKTMEDVAILKESTPSSAEEILDKVCQEWYNNINTILSQFKKGDQTEQRFTIEDMREAFEAGVACEATGETQFDEWIKTRNK